MENTPPNNLEELIQRELSKLPERPAPATLMPRVLAKIAARERKHWWQRPWTQWPLPFQLASLPFLMASLAGAFVGLSWVWDVLVSSPALQTPMADRFESLADAWDIVSVLGNAFLTLGRGVGQQWLLVALMVPLSMYLACVGLGTLCYRTAVRRR